MKIVLGVAGGLLLLSGLIGIVVIMGGVFSQAEGFTTLGGLWPGLAFHAVVTALGTGLLGKSIPKRTALVEMVSDRTGFRDRIAKAR